LFSDQHNELNTADISTAMFILLSDQSFRKRKLPAAESVTRSGIQKSAAESFILYWLTKLCRHGRWLMIGKLLQMMVGGARSGEKYVFEEGAETVAAQCDSPIMVLNIPLL